MIFVLLALVVVGGSFVGGTLLVAAQRRPPPQDDSVPVAQIAVGGRSPIRRRGPRGVSPFARAVLAGLGAFVLLGVGVSILLIVVRYYADAGR